jgi:DNA-binding transcriptional regulator YiaG
MDKEGYYHYTECGLNDVYLTNGFSVDKDGALFIEHIHQLHDAIGLRIVQSSDRLNGKEIRFIRHHLDLSQKAFGELLGVTYLTVLRWEKGEKPIQKTADHLIRTIYSGQLSKHQPIMEMLSAIVDMDKKQCTMEEEMRFRIETGEWKSAA